MKIYRRSVVFCAVILSLFLFAGVMTGREEAAAIEERHNYIVSSFNGKVAVFSQKDGAPMASTDIELSGLRDADREMIIKGVTVGSYEELLRLVEDLNS